MFHNNESRAADPAFAMFKEAKLDTSNNSETHTSTQLPTTLNADHQRASNMLGYALALNDLDTWMGTVQVLKKRLSDHELAALSFAALKAQKPEHAAMTAEAVFGLFATPAPPLISAMEEASNWADHAEPGYVKACVLAGYNRMPPKDQAAFLSFVQGRKAA